MWVPSRRTRQVSSWGILGGGGGEGVKSDEGEGRGMEGETECIEGFCRVDKVM